MGKKSPGERRRWWEESKRLEEGVLLCFLCWEGTRSSLLFFTVTDKVCDPANDKGLSSHDSFATIKAKLAAKGQIDQETMLRLSCENTHGLLIELPGVILATFIPVLESLQSMYRLNRLPFRQWILPDRLITHDKRSELNIPPPLYARGRGFKYSLKSILINNDGSDVLIDPRSSPDDRNLIDIIQSRTSLDPGQGQALIVGLTREFAQIQGPPDTGKSFLGVRLMRILLSSMPTLAPITVV